MGDNDWDSRGWAIGTLCKAFYQFGDGFIYRVVGIENYEPEKLTTLTLDPVISVFAADKGAKHTRQRTLGSLLCTPMSIADIRSELHRLEKFIKDETERGDQKSSGDFSWLPTGKIARELWEGGQKRALLGRKQPLSR